VNTTTKIVRRGGATAIATVAAADSKWVARKIVNSLKK